MSDKIDFPSNDEIKATIARVNEWTQSLRSMGYPDRRWFYDTRPVITEIAETIGSSSDLAPKMGLRLSVQNFIKLALQVGITIGFHVAEDRHRKPEEELKKLEEMPTGERPN